MSEIIVDWRELDLQTFDCLNCIPEGAIWSRVGHTAGIDREQGGLLAYESTQRKNAGGVRTMPFHDWFASRTGEVRVRKLIIDNSDLRQQAETKSSMHISLNGGKPYPNLKTRAGRFIMYRTVIDPGGFLKKWFENPNLEEYPWFFCTHLYTHWLRYCGLTKDFNPAEQEPDDVRPVYVKRGYGKFEQHLIDGVRFGPEIRIK